jgi:hypothetical protein
MPTEQLPILNRRTGTRHLLELHRDPSGNLQIYLDGQQVLNGPSQDWEPQVLEGPAYDIWMEWCHRESDFLE